MMPLLVDASTCGFIFIVFHFGLPQDTGSVLFETLSCMLAGLSIGYSIMAFLEGTYTNLFFRTVILFHTFS
jgi:hypothetical protein